MRQVVLGRTRSERIGYAKAHLRAARYNRDSTVRVFGACSGQAERAYDEVDGWERALRVEMLWKTGR